MHAVSFAFSLCRPRSLPLLPLPLLRRGLEGRGQHRQLQHSAYSPVSAKELATRLATSPTQTTTRRRPSQTDTNAAEPREKWEEDVEEIARQLGRRDAGAYKPPSAQDWIEALQSKKRQNESLKLKCTVFDTRGKAIHGTQVFPRSSFCALHGLQTRDLRKIDISVDNSVPTILVRRGSILVNVYHIRCLIKHDSLVLFEHAAYSHGGAISSFVKSLQDALSHTSAEMRDLPFEFKALEVILSNIVKELEDEWHRVRGGVEEVIAKLEFSIDPEHLRHLLAYSREMDLALKRVVALRGMIDDLLESDDEMTDMYLTRLASAPAQPDDDHQEVEQLLESYGVQVEETENAILSLTSNVQQTQAVVELILDSSRNALLALDLKVSIVTASLTGGALLAAFFGMNLATGLEESVAAFIGAAGVSLTLAGVTAVLMLRRLRNLRRVGLGTSSFGQLPARLRPARPGDEIFARPVRETRPRKWTKLF